MRRLIVAADDFAYSRAVDDAILGLVVAGRITAASCLVTSPRWPEAARCIEHVVRAKADIGLHLDLTEFVRPAGNHARLVLASACGALGTHRVHAAIDEQLRRFEDGLSAVPDYIDGHRHVHQLPGVRDVLLDAVRERYPRRPPWIRVSYASRPGAGLKGAVVSLLGGREMPTRCRELGLTCNRRLLGFYDFSQPGDDHRARLREWLTQVRTGDVLMCHPAARADPADPISAARQAEWMALRSDWWPTALREANIELSRGDALRY
jgi:hypothetical protein